MLVSILPALGGDSTARAAHLSAYDNNTWELQTDSCLILLEGYCSEGIYFGFSAKKRTQRFYQSTYICFSWKQKKTRYPKKPFTVINLWGFIQVSLGIWTYLKWLSDKAE